MICTVFPCFLTILGPILFKIDERFVLGDKWALKYTQIENNTYYVHGYSIIVQICYFICLSFVIFPEYNSVANFIICNYIILQTWDCDWSKMTKVKQREAANRPVDQATLSVNERILKECHQLYTDPDNGLVSSWYFLKSFRTEFLVPTNKDQG